jgi:hypothetical protein
MGDTPRLKAVDVTFPSNDPERPNLVWARGLDQAPVLLGTDPQTIRLLEDDRLNAKIGEYLGLVHGGAADGTKGLEAAYALYRGVKRPCVTQGHDEEVCAYILNPDRSYTYSKDAKLTGDGPHRVRKPDLSVFIVYAYLSPWELATSSGVVATQGVISFWEWVLSDTTDSLLPRDCITRYTEKIWDRRL